MTVGVSICIRHSAEAIKLYCQAFGLELGYHVLNEDGTFFHSELLKNGEEALSVVEEHRDVIMDNPVMLGFPFDTREELEQAFHILKETGTVKMDICELPWSPCAAEVIDCYGIRWYLTLSQHRPAEDFSPSDC